MCHKPDRREARESDASRAGRRLAQARREDRHPSQYGAPPSLPPDGRATERATESLLAVLGR